VLDVFHFLHISFGVHVFPVCPDERYKYFVE